MYKNPCLMVDAYKLGHYFQMPPGIKTVFSTWTARSNKHHPDCPKTVVFGHQGFIKEYLVDFFNENFFSKDIQKIKADFERKVGSIFSPTYASFDRFEALHKLGHLPIAVWGVPEGTLLPINIPDHVLYNTHPDFAWLPQYLEDIWSCHNWAPTTSATSAYYRRKLIHEFTTRMCEDPYTVARHMCGDFSMRGMMNEDAAYTSTAGHLVSFDRTATVEGNAYLEQYYGADIEHMPPGLGVPSLEHSVVCENVAYYKQHLCDGNLPERMRAKVHVAMMENWEPNLIAEMCFLMRLLTEVQPTGMLTYVSDTYDYWKVVSKVVPFLRDIIMERDGCLAIRPDSGDPVKILCGDPAHEDPISPEAHGTLNILLHHFGYTTNSKGYRVLPPNIRVIYGDAITSDIIRQVGGWCLNNQVSIENLAFGIGAYTYQYVTRDTRGFAIKATDAIFEDGELPLYKAPKTAAWKSSPKGCVAVRREINGEPIMVDGLTLPQFLGMQDKVYVRKFEDGVQYNIQSIYDIRRTLWGGQF